MHGRNHPSWMACGGNISRSEITVTHWGVRLESALSRTDEPLSQGRQVWQMDRLKIADKPDSAAPRLKRTLLDPTMERVKRVRTV